MEVSLQQKENKKKILNKQSLDDPIKHKSVPLSCNLEPDIAVIQRELITRTKQMISETQQLVDPLMHSKEPLSCDLEPAIMVR